MMKIYLDANNEILSIAEYDCLTVTDAVNVLDYEGIVPSDLSLGYRMVNGIILPADDYQDKKLNQRKIKGIEKIKKRANEVRRKAVGNESYLKVNGWALKAERSKRFLEGDSTPLEEQLLETECIVRNKGETIQDLAAKQYSKASTLAMNMVKVDGYESKAVEAVTDETTMEAIDQILDTFDVDMSEIENSMQ